MCMQPTQMQTLRLEPSHSSTPLEQPLQCGTGSRCKKCWFPKRLHAQLNNQPELSFPLIRNEVGTAPGTRYCVDRALCASRRPGGGGGAHKIMIFGQQFDSRYDCATEVRQRLIIHLTGTVCFLGADLRNIRLHRGSVKDGAVQWTTCFFSPRSSLAIASCSKSCCLLQG